jgi:hypothetical protein
MSIAIPSAFRHLQRRPIRIGRPRLGARQPPARQLLNARGRDEARGLEQQSRHGVAYRASAGSGLHPALFLL